MQVKVEKGSIVKLLSLAQTVTEKKGFPFLSHVLLYARDNTLEITATDLDILLKISAEAEIKDEGAVTAPARRLLDAIKEFPGDVVELTGDNTSRLKIIAENIDFELPSFDPEDFPLPHSEEGIEFQKCNRETLQRAIQKTFHAIPSVDNQLASAGLYWTPMEGEIHRFVACDVNRLASYDINREEIGIGEMQGGILIPKKGVIELLKFLDENESIEIAINEKGLFARSDNMLLWIKLVEDYFAFYNDLVPEVRPHSIRIPTDRFKQALKRMAIFTDQIWKHLKFRIFHNTLELEAGNPEIGTGKEIIPVDYSGDELSVAFNLRYVADAVNVIHSDYIQFEWVDEVQGGVFLDTDDKSYLAIVMPMITYY